MRVASGTAELIQAAELELLRRDMNERFDAYMAGSRPNEFQKEILDDWGSVPVQAVLAGNQSGKSTTGGRVASWFLAENKPGWVRPEKWGTGPLTGMIIGRTSKQVEHELLKKIQGFFKPDELHVHRQGGAAQYVKHKKTGNMILLASHHAEAEAREKVQSFVLNFVWLDEMPKSYLLFEELNRRLQSKDGLFICTFTPKVKNAQIRKLVDSYNAPYAKKYRMPMFANPALSEARKAQILEELANYPETLRNCILNGDWMDGETAVYHLDLERICTSLPSNYSKGWVHVEGADPAMDSKHGQVIYAQDPETAFWYIMMANYIDNIASPEDLVRTATSQISDLNVIRRVADAASTWYIKQAHKMGYTYTTPYDKNNRKEEMMKNLQRRLGKDVFITEEGMDFLNELQEMQWSETSHEKIVNDRKYHLHYAGMYALDKLPKERIPPQPKTWDMMVHERMNRPAAKQKKPSGVLLRVARRAKWK